MEHGNLSFITTDPVFKIDYANPTADKPQSKLWYQYNSWWALLPRATGPSLWQRTNEGWIEHTEVAKTLIGVPGRTDVWAEDKDVTAVGVADHSLTVFQLTLKSEPPQLEWKAKILAELFTPDINDLIETATIAKDGIGGCFVSAVASMKVCIWSKSGKSEQWIGPIVLATGIDEDDICVITPLVGGIGVIWSDQVREAVLMRLHIDGQPAEKWEDEEIIEIGNKTADDHLNTCLASNGTLWVATKNSVDSLGKPQLVLRIRYANGKWVNKPYANVEKTLLPTRPIVIVTGDNNLVFTGFSNNYQKNDGITFSIIDTALKSILKNPQVVILPDTSYRNFVNNVTGPRHPFPVNAPWIILASDQYGRVYEFDLKRLVY